MSVDLEEANNEALGISKEQLLSAYREMFRARIVDQKAITLYKQNKCHFQIGCAGHEAIQVAAAHALKPGHDWAYPYYREMALVGALGMTNREHFLGCLNKAEDPNSGGRQMPMHYGHKNLNIVSQSSPTGTQFLQAVGAAMAIQRSGKDRVVYVSSGEGTTSQGEFHEALNWAARKKLPVLFVVQDNKYAISVHISEQTAGASVSQTFSGYQGLDVVEVDGLDYFASYKVMSQAAQRARNGEGPSLIVADVIRMQSHSISDNQKKYRSIEDIAAEKLRDPLLSFRKRLIELGVVDQAAITAINAEITKEVDEDAEWADEQADPEPHTFADHVLIVPDPGAHVHEADVSANEEFFMVDALNHALDEELSLNPDMLIFGQDVAGGKGGVFSVTAGLTDKYGADRVFNSPLAEASIVGAAVGLATLGLKPVAEVQFGDYVWTAMMQIRNELATMLYRSNGEFSCPAVIRIPVGGYIHGALYHSQNIEATFSHFPGLIVIYPSNATDAKGLLKSAIRAKDPVLFLEHKGLYRQVYAKAPTGGIDDLTPIGRAKIVKAGTDATIVTWGALVQKSLAAANEVEKTGASVEVIDIRTISPLDISTILQSVRKTNRLLLAHEDVQFMGFGAEIAALVAERAFEYLEAPIRRVAGKFTPIPHAAALEKEVLPQTENILRSLRELLNY